MKSRRRKQKSMLFSRTVAGLAILGVALLHFHLGLFHASGTHSPVSGIGPTLSSESPHQGSHDREAHPPGDRDSGPADPSHEGLHEHDGGSLLFRERLPSRTGSTPSDLTAIGIPDSDRGFRWLGAAAFPIRSPATAIFILHRAFLI